MERYLKDAEITDEGFGRCLRLRAGSGSRNTTKIRPYERGLEWNSSALVKRKVFRAGLKLNVFGKATVGRVKSTRVVRVLAVFWGACMGELNLVKLEELQRRTRFLQVI